MRVRSLLPALLAASLLYAGCTQSTPAPPAQSKDASPVPTPKDAALTTPAQAPGVLPELTPVKCANCIGRISPSTATKFTFAVFGDNQGDASAVKVVTRIFQAVHDYQPQPAFAFGLGDIVEGKDPDQSDAYIKKKFQDYLDLAKTAGVPVFNAPGNHEMDDRHDIPSERMHKLYEDTVAPTYGAFDYGNAHFIALNTEDVPPQGTPLPVLPAGVEFSYLGDTQLQQLDQDLAANKTKTHIFIMMHYPMEPKPLANHPSDALAPDSLAKLKNILAKYKNISYVLASHQHLFYNPQEESNVTTVKPFKAGEPTRFLVSGGAGAAMYGHSANVFHHYLIIEVDGDNVSVTINRV